MGQISYSLSALRENIAVFSSWLNPATISVYALITTSIFDRPPLERRRRSYGPQEEAATGDRGSTYYGFAANLSERINRKHPGVTVVLQKLSERFDTYVTILRKVRIDHLKLTEKLSNGEIFHLQREAHENARPFLAG